MQIPYANCDARPRIPDASFPIFCDIRNRSLEVLFDDMAFDGSVNALALVSRNSRYIPDRSCPLHIPSPLSAHFDQNYYSRNAAQKFVHLHTTQRSAPSCARVSVNGVANRLLEGRRLAYGALLCRTAKSADRPAGTTCHCGFNSSVQPFPVNGVLLTSVGAGT